MERRGLQEDAVAGYTIVYGHNITWVLAANVVGFPRSDTITDRPDMASYMSGTVDKVQEYGK